MTTLESATEQPEDPQQLLQHTREHVLGSLMKWVALTVMVVGPYVLLQGHAADSLLPSLTVYVGVGSAIFPLVLCRRYLSFHAAAASFALYLFALGAFPIPFRGLVPGSAVLLISLVLLTALLIGLRAAMAVLAVCVLSLPLGMLGLRDLGLTQWSPHFWDAGSPVVTVRYALVFGLLGAGLSVAFSRIIAVLEHNAASLHENLQRERAEHRARVAAERDLALARRTEAIAQIASGMVHDFNNSLTVIMGSADLIRRQPERAEELANSISEVAESASNTVRELLSLGRREAPRPAPLRVANVVRKVERTLRSVLPPDVKLDVHMDTEAEALAHTAWLEHALVNLALNARDAMPHGGTIAIRVHDATLGGTESGTERDYVVLTCSDNGEGMDEATKARVFEPFFTTKSAGRGSGLGLLMVRALVEAVGGFLELETARHQGTAFRLFLPAVPSPGGADVRERHRG